MACSGEILAGHANKCPGEIGSAGSGGFVGEDAGVEELWKPLPMFRALDAICETQSLEVDLGAQLNAFLVRKNDWQRECVGAYAIGKIRHHPQMSAVLVARDVAVVELRGVVVADESCGLLVVLRVELEHRGNARAV